MVDLISATGGTTPAVQDYLKQIYMLESEQSESAVQTTALASRLGVSAASATSMLKKLATLGFITHTPYQGAQLTPGGRKVALEVLRHHRLLETYLAEVLGVPWDEVHDEAEILEHFLSERLEERMAAMLGHPTHDPHGHPIPDHRLDLPEPSARTLWEVEDGATVEISSVPDSRAEALRYLGDMGIRPGATVEIVRRGPVGGPLFVRADSRDEQAISKELSEEVWVRGRWA
jgi:DtxR family Mn-dependent transcriptional regulator